MYARCFVGHARGVELMAVQPGYKMLPSDRHRLKAIRQLRKSDVVLDRIIEDRGPCTLRPRGDGFCALCKAIISQQISTRVADVIEDRFLNLFPRRRPVARRLLAMSETQLRSVGLSGQKVRYIQNLAGFATSGALGLSRIDQQSDDEIIASLTRVKGVGVWTAQMFLIFVLNRPDVLPVDDFGLKNAVMQHYGLAELPRAAELHRIAESWRPFRTFATWYMWRSLDEPTDASR